MGLMLESHLVAGRQSLAGNQPLRYGQSMPSLTSASMARMSPRTAS